MEDMLKIGLWFIIAILCVNSAITYLDATDTFRDNGLSLGLIEGTIFDTDRLPTDTEQTNYVSPNIVETASNLLFQFANTIGLLLFSIFKLYFAWLYLLNSIFFGIPGAGFFIGILSWIFIVIQAVATFVILAKVGAVIGGLRP